MIERDTLGQEQQILAATSDAAILTFGTHGIIEITGNDALDLLHRLSTNDLRHLAICECRGTVLTTDKGRIVDYVHLVKTQSRLVMLTSPGCEQSVVDWIGKYTIMEDIKFNIVTSARFQISIIGPNSVAYANSALNLALSPWSSTECTLADGRTTIVSSRKEFGTTSVDIIAQENRPISISRLTEIIAMSRDGYETFRVMQGIPLTQHELREEFNPFETGLTAAISSNKGCYIGQEVIARLDTYQKVQKRLVGLRLSLTHEVISMVPLLYSGNEVGWITSTAPLRYNAKQYGLGIIRKEIGAGENVAYEKSGGIVYANVTDIPILTNTGNL